MKKIFLSLFLIIIIFLCVGYFAILGVGPKDLEIRVTPEDSTRAQSKVGTEILTLNPGSSIEDFTLEGKKTAEFTMNSQELTALANNRPWINYPLKNLQIKIHQDGTIESSGTLIVKKALPYALALGYSESQIKDAMAKYNLPPLEIPIYVLGKGTVISDKVRVQASTVKIGMIPLPENIVSEANVEAQQVLEDIIKKHSHSFHADSVTFQGGVMEFKGQVAEKEYVLGY